MSDLIKTSRNTFDIKHDTIDLHTYEEGYQLQSVTVTEPMYNAAASYAYLALDKDAYKIDISHLFDELGSLLLTEIAGPESDKFHRSKWDDIWEHEKDDFVDEASRFLVLEFNELAESFTLTKQLSDELKDFLP